MQKLFSLKFVILECHREGYVLNDLSLKKIISLNVNAVRQSHIVRR